MRTKIFAIALLLFLTACAKSVPHNFEDISGIYFSNTYNRILTDNMDYTFVYESESVSEILVPVKLQLLGRTAGYDRPIALEISSDNAVEGRDYEWKSELILPADSTKAELYVALFRQSELKESEKSITLTLKENDDFMLPFSHQKLSGGEMVSALSYTINYSEMFTAPPQGWRTYFAGTFSQRKFELLCKVSGVDRNLFNTPGGISDAKWMFMLSRVMEYILTQENLRSSGQDYDEDAFDENGIALDFNR